VSFYQLHANAWAGCFVSFVNELALHFTVACKEINIVFHFITHWWFGSVRDLIVHWMKVWVFLQQNSVGGI